MCRRKPLSGRQEMVDDLVDRTRLLPQPRSERGSFDELHGHEDRRSESAHVVDGNDVGMRQLRQRLRLAQQPLRRLLFLVAVQDQLEREEPIELGIVRAVDDGHTAATQLVEHDVATTDARTARERGERPRRLSRRRRRGGRAARSRARCRGDVIRAHDRRPDGNLSRGSNDR